ncbi:MAG TPA: FAD-dependent monooxygenase, partial [Ktedonobacterales bacterium]|nr:FAD-dependent monooxygenase [Ktedonobacterales bacterium]
MKITVLGGGPAGLYCSLLLKKANPAHQVRLVERNPPDATYGWGVVFSDRTLAAFQEADYPSYKAITSHFTLWDAIDTIYQGQLIRCGGHVFAGLERKTLLALLQRRCYELGVALEFATEAPSLEWLGEADLLIAADGVNSLARRTHEDAFQPSIKQGRARYIWLGADKTLDAFTFIFRQSEYGLFQVHSYPFGGATSTFIVECAEDVWLRAGLDQADEAASVAFCERLFAEELRGHHLLSNNSKWISFATLKCAHWHTGNLVLLGDSAHTAHFSIGSGTKLAMEDAIALANAIEQYPDMERALSEYEQARRPVVELFQAAAVESQGYFENTRRYTSLPPAQFTFNLLTRSKRITYDDLRLRDPRFGDWVDRELASPPDAACAAPAYAPPPLFTAVQIGGLRLPNRIATQTIAGDADDTLGGVGLRLAGMVAIAPDARIHSECAGLYSDAQAEAWTQMAQRCHAAGSALGVTLNHAGRRGATLAPSDTGATLPDRPLRAGGWPLVSASAIPYMPASQTPHALTRAQMRTISEQFVAAAQRALACGFDLLTLHMAHGYLLASFLSPLTNQRTDDYGGALERRMRYPLEVFEAVRRVWPEEKPLAVALNCHDGA